MNNELSLENMKSALEEMGRKAVSASRVLAVMKTDDKRKLLNAMADAILDDASKIKAANAIDLENGKNNGLSSAMLDRLALDDKRIQGMADGLRIVAAEDDPVGKILSTTERPNGLKIEKISVPVGVIGIIYESRPNVTADAGGICLMAGNTVLLRGGSEAFNSNQAIADAMNRAGVSCGLPDGAVQLLPWTDRRAVSLLVTLDKYVDLIIPRGGEGLIRAVTRDATIPVIKHYKGVCHTFVDESADLNKALSIVENAKCQRPGVCNALECLVVHRNIAEKFLTMLFDKIGEKVKMYGNIEVRSILKNIEQGEPDYNMEFLDYAMNIRIVADVDEAIEHINTFSSKHSESIITECTENAAKFFASIDSSCVYHNASTRFTDGGEFGMGAEIGISTDKLHARGPMGAKELTIYKYIIHGDGQIR
ncbi:MAG: glutamate-5-semialdehyde dehydrogenase [Lentisphaeria bacterium]|nr:glutamate-5-semialdehyde dehydrogenase [Lentisphaeria bacterium]